MDQENYTLLVNLTKSCTWVYHDAEQHVLVPSRIELNFLSWVQKWPRIVLQLSTSSWEINLKFFFCLGEDIETDCWCLGRCIFFVGRNTVSVVLGNCSLVFTGYWLVLMFLILYFTVRLCSSWTRFSFIIKSKLEDK